MPWVVGSTLRALYSISQARQILPGPVPKVVQQLVGLQAAVIATPRLDAVDQFELILRLVSSQNVLPRNIGPLDG